jgi:hypothetical protein
MVPSAMLSPIWGMMTFVAMIYLTALLRNESRKKLSVVRRQLSVALNSEQPLSSGDCRALHTPATAIHSS